MAGRSSFAAVVLAFFLGSVATVVASSRTLGGLCVAITPHRQPDFVYLENRCGRCVEVTYAWQAEGQDLQSETYHMVARETTVVLKGVQAGIEAVRDCDTAESDR